MKKYFIFLFITLFCLSIVQALPVTYQGDVIINGSVMTTSAVLKSVSSLEEANKTINGSYVLNIAGTEGTNTSFYIWGELVKTVIQPVQTSIVELNLFFNKTANGDGCSYDEACLNDHCVNKDVAGVCSSEEYYCDNDGACESDYGETTTNCGTDCKRRTTGSSGGSYTNYGSKTSVEDHEVTQPLIDSVSGNTSYDDYKVVAVGSIPGSESVHSSDDLIKVLSELTNPENAEQAMGLVAVSDDLTVTKTIQKYEITNQITGKVTKKTTVSLSVTSKKDGQTIIIVEVVPKGVANSADLLEFFGVTPEILESDPIIQWTFTDTTAGEIYNVDYAVKGSLNTVDSKTYAIGSDIETPIVEEPLVEPEDPVIVGDDKDEHGCIGSAGYTWCEIKQKCLREWEEPCKDEVTVEVITPPEPEKKDNQTVIVIGILLIILLILLRSYFKKRKELKKIEEIEKEEEVQ